MYTLDILSRKLYTFRDKSEGGKMAESIANKVVSRIYGKQRGWVFTPTNFLDLGSRTTISKNLERLATTGTIYRLARGLYYYPEKHSKLGYVPANYERIAQALAGRDNVKIQPSGAYAANILGLTEQVPAKIILLTDGMNKTVQVAKQQIIFKHTTPKAMVTAGKISGLIIQALKYLGKDNVNNKIINTLKKRLNKADKQQLIIDSRYAPEWIRCVLRALQ